MRPHVQPGSAFAINATPHQHIDVVVNNAGINQANLLRAVGAASAMNPMNTNFAGVIRVNQRVRVHVTVCVPMPSHITLNAPVRGLLITRARAAGYPQHDRVGQVTCSVPF